MSNNGFDAEASIDRLREISTWVSSVQDLDQLLELIIETLTRMMDAKASSLLLLDPKTRKLYFKVATGEKGTDVKQFEIDLGQGTDYRFNRLERKGTYFIGDSARGDAYLQQQLLAIAPCAAKHNRQIIINERPIDYIALADDVIWFDFEDRETGQVGSRAAEQFEKLGIER